MKQAIKNGLWITPEFVLFTEKKGQYVITLDILASVFLISEMFQHN